jgi:hypothetical protein
MSHVPEDVKAGIFTAEFTRGADALAFLTRLAGEPEGFYVKPGSVRLNRKGGRLVTWEAAPEAFQHSGGMFGYWQSMAETVGYYGSTFGEPPTGAGKRTACLNGMPGPAVM